MLSNINNLIGSCRFVYNKMIDFFEEFYKQNGKGASSRQAYEYFARLKTEYPFLQEVHSKVISNQRLIAIGAWGNFFKATKKPPKSNGKLRFEKPIYHSRHKHDSCHFDKQAFRYIKGDRISLIKSLSNILFKCSKRDAEYLRTHNEQVRSITLRHTPSGKYVCSILVEDERIKELAPCDKEVGIDVGVRSFATLSSGDKIENPRIIRTHIEKIKRLDRRLARCQKGSKRWEKARIRLCKAYEKLVNARKDFSHKTSTSIVRKYGTCCIENLDVAEMIQGSEARLEISNVCMSDFLSQIRYKCDWYGRRLGIVDRFFPSSKRCSQCGFINRKLTRKDIEWICPVCGQEHDRDINAAINILEEGKRNLVGLGSPEPNARGQVNTKAELGTPKADEVPWVNRETKCGGSSGMPEAES